MDLEFSWDKRKAEANRAKHRVDFREAATVFEDPHSVTVPDERHSLGELRSFTIGRSARGRLLSVAHTEDDRVIRIISARPATRAESQTHDQP